MFLFFNAPDCVCGHSKFLHYCLFGRCYILGCTCSHYESAGQHAKA